MIFDRLNSASKLTAAVLLAISGWCVALIKDWKQIRDWWYEKSEVSLGDTTVSIELKTRLVDRSISYTLKPGEKPSAPASPDNPYKYKFIIALPVRKSTIPPVTGCNAYLPSFSEKPLLPQSFDLDRGPFDYPLSLRYETDSAAPMTSISLSVRCKGVIPNSKEIKISFD